MKNPYACRLCYRITNVNRIWVHHGYMRICDACIEEINKSKDELKEMEQKLK